MKQAPPPPSPDAPRSIDVRRVIAAASHRATLDQLTSQGRTTVSLLSKARMGELIDRAIRDLVEHYRDEARNRKTRPEEPLEKSAYESLQELIKEVESANQAKAELEGSRQSLLSELGELRDALAREKRRAEEEHEDALDRSPFLGVADFDRHLAAVITRVCEAQIPPPDVEKPPGFLKEWGQIEKLVRQSVLAVVKEERARYRAPARDNKELWKMERRVEKLYTELDALEHAIKLISNSKVPNNAAVQNALRELGILVEDKNYEKKKEMLKFVLDTNQQIRKSSRELEARGISLSRPR
jgi:predicted RNase H-like nuclease (RuvC/YqgF family)